MRRTPLNRGLTLIELLIAMALMGLLGTLMAQAIIPMVRYEQQQVVVSSLQQEALIAMQQFEYDLRRCTSQGVTLVSPGTLMGVSMNRLSDVTFQNAVFWEPQLVVYGWRQGSTSLFRRLFPPGPAFVSVFFPLTRPAACPSTAAEILARTPNSTDRRLTSHVDSFTVISTGPGLYEATLKLQCPIPGTPRIAAYELARTVYLRNEP